MTDITLTGWDVLDEARAVLWAVVAGVPADGWRRPTPCTGWDAIQASPLTPALARALTLVAQGIVEPLRQYGAYAAALDAGAGADDAAALLCYLGRSPAWVA
jgi:hypothetical protein